MLKDYERTRPEFPLAWDEIEAEPVRQTETASARDTTRDAARFRASLWADIAADIRHRRAQEKKGTASC